LPAEAADSAAPVGPAAVTGSAATLLAHYQTFVTLLAAERDALTGHTPDTLEAILQRKDALCRDIQALQQTLPELLRDAPREVAQMAELRTLAQRCRDENAINGRIAQRARRTVRVLLQALTGQPDPELYTPGIPGRGAAGTRPPAARQRLGSA
jgi:flagellar biosynthesis/type III secretory pathway chaperone